jgi:hypothetical protein
MFEWNYGDAYKRHPIGDDEIAVFDDGSMVKPHDIFNPLPEFMSRADLMFVDPPWNQGNMRSFYTKANQDSLHNYDEFRKCLFLHIAEINPPVCYLEVGKDYMAEFITQMKVLYKYVSFFNSTYYHRQTNLCYVVRGSQKSHRVKLDYMDEEDIIDWICQNEDYDYVGDLCMGRGLVALAAHRNCKRFVGTELNPKRVSVLLEVVSKAGCLYEKIGL